jgi:hypothetical protein
MPQCNSSSTITSRLAASPERKELPHDHVESCSDRDREEAKEGILHSEIVLDAAPATLLHWLKHCDRVQVLCVASECEGACSLIASNNKKTHRIACDMPEVRLILNSCLSEADGALISCRTAVQYVKILLTVIYTGARPGTLFRTTANPQSHVKIRDANIHRKISEGHHGPVMTGIIVRLKRKDWKGYNNRGAYERAGGYRSSGQESDL